MPDAVIDQMERITAASEQRRVVPKRRPIICRSGQGAERKTPIRKLTGVLPVSFPLKRHKRQPACIISIAPSDKRMNAVDRDRT